MTNALFETLWDLLQLKYSPHTSEFVLVFLGGFSKAIAQSIVLFVNQVKPLRFVISLVLGALLFVVGYLAWALSIWGSGYLLLEDPLPLKVVAHSLALGYVPFVFSFLGALPYLGLPILRLLSVWSLLLVVEGFEVLANLPFWEAVLHVGLGWGVMLGLQQTVGQPFVNLGQWLTNQVSGVTLVVDPQQIRTLVDQRPFPEAPGWALGAQGGTDRPLQPAPPAAAAPTAPFAGAQRPQRGETARPKAAKLRRWLRSALVYVGLVLLTLVVVLALVPLRHMVFALLGEPRLPQRVFGPVFQLLTLGSIALVVGGLLAPLEALGWWAGWYGDAVRTLNPTHLELDSLPPPAPYRRYLVYLDGINQATATYQPAVAQYLSELEQRLPADMTLVQGVMSYSVLNRSLTQNRPLAFFWRWIQASTDRFAGMGLLINLRNVLIVAVAADRRYGSIYSQGVAQRVYEGLVRAGYPVTGGVPLTLIGYSGGGQMAMGIMPFLRRALLAPIEVISLGGVISGNVRALEAEQLYHLVGSKDRVERLGPILFPRRWPLAWLSYWNRAKRQGNISLICLGPVGHQVPGGIVDPDAFLPDGRSHLQQTLDLTLEILVGDLRQLLDHQKTEVLKPGNYYRYRAADFNRPDYYPVPQTLDARWYHPVANWVGRLILPSPAQRPQMDGGVFFELRHAPPDYQHWIGKQVLLKWQLPQEVHREFRAVIRDIHFSAAAEDSHRNGLILPTRLNHWRLVNPLESLAGARPVDDLIVKLPEPVRVTAADPDSALPCLTIFHEPIQTSGLYYALVQFRAPVDPALERYRVVHFNRQTGRFDGLEETVRLPTVVPDINGVAAATNREIERSQLNATGWYLYGAQALNGEFVVQSLRPRSLFQLQPHRFIASAQPGRRYLRRQAWHGVAQRKNTVESVLIDPRRSRIGFWGPSSSAAVAIARWQEGDQALLVHVYGGIGGAKREPAVKGPIYFGHFAYGTATVVREPLANELQFELHYHQVYTHNQRGLVAGTLDWSLYMGDRQWGFLGTRPVSDILIRLPAYTEPFQFNDSAWSALDDLRLELEIMTARYRTGDGNGVTYVGPANNCAQDSNQAMYASARHLEGAIAAQRAGLKTWDLKHPRPAKQFRQLLRFRQAIQRQLLPFGSARADWDEEQETLGSNLSDFPLKTVGRGLLSWRTMLPRKASDTIAELCLSHGAALWVLRTNQVGGHDPDIKPLAPITL